MLKLALLAMAGMATAMDTSDQPGDDLVVMAGTTVVHLANRDAHTGQITPLHPAIRTGENPEAIARDALRHAGLDADEWAVVSNYKTKHNGLTHITLRQHLAGLACTNCIAVTNIDTDGRVLNLGYTAHTGRALASTTPTLTTRQALEYAVQTWNATVPAEATLAECDPIVTECNQRQKFTPTKGLSPFDVPVQLEVIATGTDEARLIWQVSIETEDPYYHMYEVSIDAHTGQVLQLFDNVNWDNWGTPDPNRANNTATALRGSAPAQASKQLDKDEGKVATGTYTVYSIPLIDPTLGPRVEIDGGFDERSSPLGWHDKGDVVPSTETLGNNVCAQENRGNSAVRACEGPAWFRPDGGEELDFRFEFDEAADPTTDPTQSAAIVNLFYWHNIFHDILHLGGFDEPAGNFQENNFDNGGIGGDAIQANAQDGAGFNNANFATPVDGQRPRCRMYLWNAWTPFRDGDFDSGIVVHEHGHGVSNRLTGGPNVVGCLPGGQSGGMGEGWSDWWAIQLQQRTDHTPATAFPMGDYVVTGGIRIYPYSYDMDINPATYAFITGPAYSGVHAMGSFWCGALHDVYWLMRLEFGWSTDWYDGDAGNNFFWQNVLDGNKLQPCQPNMLQARDAILLADAQNYEGRHTCVMWCGFARRGMGVSATSGPANGRDVVEEFDFPPACECTDVYNRADVMMANSTVV